MTNAATDQKFLWHPFTQMRDWCDPSHESIVIVEGEGVVLTDDQGRRYLDGNSSIWTNLHGHRHPKLDQAIKSQLDRIAHASFLGLTNDLAPRLAQYLVSALMQSDLAVEGVSPYRVFLSDDGSTAMETALKMVFQARQQRGETSRTKFLSLSAGYHGDTIGAMSAGHSTLFHKTYRPLLFETVEVTQPACYRCPYNRAAPERGAEARATRRCSWECVTELEKALDQTGEQAAALVMEPLVQGAAGMAMHPEGYLSKAAKLCRERDIWLLLDEVMTGFGRTGALFACQKEEVQPDLMALAKGLTAGYLPLAATLASKEIFEAFLGDYSEFKTFFHGHSYSGNPLGCAAALANMEIFETESTLSTITFLSGRLRAFSQPFWRHPHVGEVRQEGLILAIELVEDFASRKPFPPEQRIGMRVCDAARAHGLLTRPIGNVLVLMPPYIVTEEQLSAMTSALWKGLCEVLPF